MSERYCKSCNHKTENGCNSWDCNYELKSGNQKDRIECAIRHIKTAIDVDPWARDIAVEAMQRMIAEVGE